LTTPKPEFGKSHQPKDINKIITKENLETLYKAHQETMNDPTDRSTAAAVIAAGLIVGIGIAVLVYFGASALLPVVMDFLK